MKRSSVLPRNYYKRPKVKLLVPEVKLLLTVIVVGCESHVGVAIPSGEPEDTGLNCDSVKAGKIDLVSKQLIEIDDSTGELFIKDFFRDNTFKTTQRVCQAKSDFNCIESAKLKLSVLDAIKNNPDCGLTAKNLTNIDTVYINQHVNNQAEAEVEVEVEVEVEIPAATAVIIGKNVSNSKNELVIQIPTLQLVDKTTTQPPPDDFSEIIEAGVIAPANERDLMNFGLIKSKFTKDQLKNALSEIATMALKKPYSTCVLTQLEALKGSAVRGAGLSSSKKVLRYVPPESFDAESVRKDNENQLIRAAKHGGNVEII